MANVTITTSQNFDSPSITGMRNGEDITIRNAAILTIDSDSISAHHDAIIGNITINNVEGGQVIIDGTKVWELPFDNPTGNVPPLSLFGTINVTGATSLATGEYLGIWSYSTLPPLSSNLPAISASLYRITTPTAIPASGFIKLRTKTGTFLDNETVNLYNGATVQVNHISGGKRGWLNIVGEEGSTINVPRVGTFTVNGDWYELGETDGTDGQVFQFFAADEPPAISVEISAGAGNYEWWLNAGTRWRSPVQTVGTDERGKFFGMQWHGTNSENQPARYDFNSGRIEIANRGLYACGYKPPTGCKVRIPNIHVSNRRSPWNANALNGTVGTRWDFTTTSAGVVNLDKVGGNWYISCTAPYSVNFKNSSFMHAVQLSNAANYSYMDNCAVGCSTYGALTTSPLNFTVLLTGISITNSKFVRQQMSGNGDTVLILTDINDLTFNNNEVFAFGQSTLSPTRTGTSSLSLSMTRVNRGVFNNNAIVGAGTITTAQSTDLEFNGTKYADLLTGNTASAVGVYAFNFANSTYRANINGFSNYKDLPNVQPYTGVVTLTNSYNCKIRNIGTPENPYNAGANPASGSGLLINVAASTEIEAKRIYAKNVRTAALGTVNTAQNLIIENVWADDNDSQVNAWINNTPKGCRWLQSTTGQTSVYGKHWDDVIRGDSAQLTGNILISCNEALDTTAEQCSATQGNPQFSSTGALTMQLSGDQITWTTPDYLIGHERFAPVEPIWTLTGLTKQNTQFIYRLADGRNDIETYGNWKSLVGANLSAETFTPSAGFKLQVRATTVVPSATNSLTFIQFTTYSTSASRNLQYPLATPLITFTDVPSSAIAAGWDSTNFQFQKWSLAGDANTVGVKAPWSSNHNNNFRIRAPGYSTNDTVLNIIETSQSVPSTLTEYSTIPASDPGVLSISAMIHDSPVTWNSKNFSTTIQLLNNGITASQVANWLNWNTASILPFFGRRGISWPELIIPNATSFETKRGILYGDDLNNGPIVGLRVVQSDGVTPVAGFTRMQSDDGTYWVPPQVIAMTFSGLITGSQVVVYETGTTTERFRTNSSGTSELWTESYTTDVVVDYTIQKAGYIPIRVTGVNISFSPVTINAQQTVDRTYLPSTGLTFGTNATIDITGNRVAVTVPTTVQNWYSFMIESWISQSVLRNLPFFLSSNGPNSITLGRGYEWYDNTSIELLSKDGMQYQSLAGVTTAQWAAILSIGEATGIQPKYQYSHSGPTVFTNSTGVVDQLIQIYGDASHGNFTRKDYLIMKMQADGYYDVETDVVATYGNLEDQLYVIGMAPASTGLATGLPPVCGSPSITDHGASPVTWNGKDFSITITDSSIGNTGENLLRWLSYNKGLNGTFQGKDSFDWHQMIEQNGSSYKTVNGKLYEDTGAVIKGVRVVKSDGTTPHPDFNLFTADDGTTYVPPAISYITAPNIVSGSRVQIYNVTTATEIQNIELSGSGYSYQYFNGSGITNGDTVRFRATYQNGLTAYDLIESVSTASVQGASFGDIQTTNSVYAANAIDGSTCTEFIPDYPNVEIDINDPDGITSPMRLFAWYHYIVTTEFGIANFFGGMTAVDSVNYQINVGTLNMLLDNVTATPVKINDAYMYRSDGTTVIASGSGSIQMDPGKAYLANSARIVTDLTAIKKKTGLIPGLF